MKGPGKKHHGGKFGPRRGGRGGKQSAIPQRRSFKAARIEEKRSETDSSDENSDAELNQPPVDAPSLDDESDQESSDDEEDKEVSESYKKLLLSLAVKRPAEDVPSKAPKKQKLHREPGIADASNEPGDLDNGTSDQMQVLGNEQLDLDLPESEEDDSNHEEELPQDLEDPANDPEGYMGDPFEAHFASPDTTAWSQNLKSYDKQPWCTTQNRKAMYTHRTRRKDWDESLTHFLPTIGKLEDVHLKQKLMKRGQYIWRSLKEEERDFAEGIFDYRDALFALRGLHNAASLQQLVLLHAMNHVFKTRDRVLKNNSKLAHATDNDGSELRDQGFTRPKVLIILPTRQACVRFVESLIEICEPEQQENKARFFDSFSQAADEAWDQKPRDFQDLFGGNDDDMFRIGLKFTRKTLRFFSAFYSSDIILASPLGLRRAIESSPSKDGKPIQDSDFLSSIEILIMDHATALLMQNWQHVEYIFNHLNLLPRESHGCDFSRVRHWSLDGLAKHFRQTIILTDFLTPEIKSLATHHLHNLAGLDEYTPIYPTASSQLDTAAATLPFPITQRFQRFHPPTPLADADARFALFTSTILPTLLPSPTSGPSRPTPARTLLYTPTYASFLRIRNHLSTSPTTAALSFGAISEYTSVRDVARARSHFMSGRHSVLLYSERAHHFRRYVLRGVRRVVFYGVPENLAFWGEVVGMLGVGDEGAAEDRGGRETERVRVRALFSRFDALKLERIVGEGRMGKMVYQREGDVFEFT